MPEPNPYAESATSDYEMYLTGVHASREYHAPIATCHLLVKAD